MSGICSFSGDKAASIFSLRILSFLSLQSLSAIIIPEITNPPVSMIRRQQLSVQM